MFVRYVFVKHTCFGRSETKALVTNTTLNDGKCHYFDYIGDFSLFNLEALHFFKPNNSKSNHEKSI